MKEPSLHPFFFRTFLCLIFVFTFSATACNKKTSLTLFNAESSFSLQPLNKAAKTGSLAGETGADYLYYRFEESEELVSLLTGKDTPLPQALNLTFRTDEAASVAVAWLYTDDFSGKKLKKGTLSQRPLVSADIAAEKTTAISFALPSTGGVCGFLVYAKNPVTLLTAELKDVRFGIIRSETHDTVCFGPDGGSWNAKNGMSDSFNFTQADQYLKKTDGAYLVLHFRDNPSDAGQNGNAGKVTLKSGRTEVTVRRTKAPQTLHLYADLLESRGEFITVTQNADMLTGIEYVLIPKVSDITPMQPIITDPGTIIDWPMNIWRSSDYEVFCWEQFPSILIFDTRDYAVQDDLFKRLAFYAEKVGWRGTLAPDSTIQDQHGFNAHDYRAETLAAFFTEVEKQHFPINHKEQELRDILLSHGIIVQNETGYTPGEGAIVSISQESARYLRVQLLTHESLHGVYFLTPTFRDCVANVINTMDRKSLDFIYAYFASQPSLGYDSADEYLMKNEFMAYVLQQGVSSIPNYFAGNIAWRGSVLQALPELAEYIRGTNAQGLVDAAKIMDTFLFENWSINAGRSWLTDITRN